LKERDSTGTVFDGRNQFSIKLLDATSVAAGGKNSLSTSSSILRIFGSST
jgi:hypothetical protein